MKRLFALLLIVSMMMGLAACSPNVNANDSTSENGEKIVKIGLSMSTRDQFLSTLETAVKESAEGKAELSTFDAEADIQKQLQHVTTCASQKYDAMIVNIVDANSATEILSAAGEMPVIFVNRIPTDESLLEEGKSHYVGSSEEQAGEIQAEYLTKLFNEKNQKEIKYALIMGTPAMYHAVLRTDSVKKSLEAAGFTLTKVFEDTADWDRAIAMEKMQQFLGTGKEFDVVICNNDEMALGAIEAMKTVNKLTVPVVGIDATTNAVASIESGELACSVFQDAQGQGQGAFEFAMQLANGEKPEKIKWIPFKLVDKNNVAEFK